MERQIEIYKREGAVTPKKLENDLYQVEWVGLVRIEPHKDNSRRFTLILGATKDYDVQEVGYVISSSGYSVILPSLTEPKPRKSILESLVSAAVRTTKELEARFSNSVREYSARKYNDDLASKKAREEQR